MKPTLGRIIHVWWGDEWLAAIVTRTTDSSSHFRANLFHSLITGPLISSLWLEDEGKTWRWPPREPETGGDRVPK